MRSSRGYTPVGETGERGVIGEAAVPAERDVELRRVGACGAPAMLALPIASRGQSRRRTKLAAVLTEFDA
jgi:hypothetical protein